MSKYIFPNNPHKKFKNTKFWWLKWFIPTIFVNNFLNLSINYLNLNNIKIIVCDIDNTLISVSKQIPNNEIRKFIRKIKKNNIKIVLLSNNYSSRAKKIAKWLKINDYYGFAFKPFYHKLSIIQKKYQVSKNEMIVVGNQLLTDIFMANLFGCKSILTYSIHHSNNKLSTLINWIESFIYKILINLHIFPYNLSQIPKHKIIKQDENKIDWW